MGNGWCTYCNGNFCPCGSCSCASSCACSCGRKTVLQQSVKSCCNSNSGTKFCKEPVIYLTSNFTIPEANEEVEIKVSDSSKLYEGQGIQIATGYYQVTEITDSRNIKVAHNGTATPGTAITAVNPSYGCYQYPIYYVGIVELAFETEDILGLDASFEEVADSIVDPVLSFTYGYSGPNKIEFNVELSVTIANAPIYISIPLPEAGAEGTASFSALTIEGGEPGALVAYKKETELIIGYGEGFDFVNGSNTIYISGSYGV